MSINIEAPYQNFVGLDGKPLSNGNVYIGSVGTDPTVVANQIPVFWDDAMTIPAAQPLRTNAGYIVRNGTPSRVYANSDYSITVSNPSNVVVYYLDHQGILDFSGPNGSSRIGFIQVGDGAVARTVQSKERDIISLYDFMTTAEIADSASGAPTIDLTAKLMAAHDALPSIGGEIFVPPGTYIINGVTFNKAVKIRGSGQKASIFKTTSTTANVVNMTVFGSCASDIGFDSSVPRTAGIFLNMASAWYSSVTNVFFNKFYIGLNIDNVIGCNVRNVAFLDGTASTVAAGGCMIRVGETAYCGNINIDGAEADVNVAAAQPSYGILLRYVDVMTITNSLIIHHGTDLMVAPHSGQLVGQLYCYGNSFDTAGRGILIQPETGGQVVHCSFDSCWTGAHTIDGTAVNGTLGAVNFISFNSLLSVGNAGIAVNVFGVNALNIMFSASCRASNSGGNGFQLTQNCNAYWDGGFIGNNTGFGAVIELGCSGAIRNCKMDGNTNGPILNLSPVLFGESGNSPYAWNSSFTPVVSASAGAVVAVANFRHKRVNKTVHFNIVVNVTNSTGSGVVTVSLPFQSGPSAQAASGVENGATGKQLHGVILANDTVVRVRFYDGTYPGAAGNTLILSGSYEVA